jgi:hypothetical protein
MHISEINVQRKAKEGYSTQSCIDFYVTLVSGMIILKQKWALQFFISFRKSIAIACRYTFQNMICASCIKTKTSIHYTNIIDENDTMQEKTGNSKPFNLSTGNILSHTPTAL